MDLAQGLQAVVYFGVFPLWLLAGLGDWLCHRASAIERTSGSKESVFHLVLYFEIAVPALAVLFFRVTTPVLSLLAVGVFAHFVTSLWDTRYAQPRRHISPIEQLVHSFLEMLPLFGLLLLALLHASEPGVPDWRLVMRHPTPLVTFVVCGALFAGLAFIIEEWWRGRRREAAVTGGHP